MIHSTISTHRPLLHTAFKSGCSLSQRILGQECLSAQSLNIAIEWGPKCDFIYHIMKATAGRVFIFLSAKCRNISSINSYTLHYLARSHIIPWRLSLSWGARSPWFAPMRDISGPNSRRLPQIRRWPCIIDKEQRSLSCRRKQRLHPVQWRMLMFPWYKIIITIIISPSSECHGINSRPKQTNLLPWVTMAQGFWGC